MSTAYPLEDCCSRALQLTNTRGVGASRGALGEDVYSTDVVDAATLELCLLDRHA